MQLHNSKANSFRTAHVGLILALLAGPVSAQEQSAAKDWESTPAHYTVIDFGVVGNPPGQPYFITNNGLISGGGTIPGGNLHATLWFEGAKFDIGTTGLGGPNNIAYGVNRFGQTVGAAETSVSDPEDFCGFNGYGFPSASACRPFVWQEGVMTILPTLGGENGFANMINHRGEVAGLAEDWEKGSVLRLSRASLRACCLGEWKDLRAPDRSWRLRWSGSVDQRQG